MLLDFYFDLCPPLLFELLLFVLSLKIKSSIYDHHYESLTLAFQLPIV
jgi:hypothetical protein